MIKKLITGAIAAAITATSVLAGGFSTTPPSSKNSAHTQSNDVNNDYDLRATNSLGKYITQASHENNINPDLKLMSDSKKDSFNVTNLTFDAESGLIHAVSSQTTECTIVFSFIDEETNDIVQEVKKTVEAGEYISSEAKADTAILPQYFIVEAKLVDKKGKTVSNVFKLNEYTKIMHEIAATDIHDFDEAQVINFDESEETNFIVLSEDTVKAESSENENTLVTADFDSNTFVFENIDETIQYLQSGDLLYVQPDEENIIAIEVDDISIDGDTATIKGNENIDDMFEFIKLESETNNKNVTIDTSNTDDIFVFPEHENETEFTLDSDKPLLFESNPKSRHCLPFAIDFSYEKTKSFSLEEPLSDVVTKEELDEKGGLGFRGGIEFTTKINFYLKGDYLSVGFLFTPKIHNTITFSTGEFPRTGDRPKFSKAIGETMLAINPILAKINIPTAIPGLHIITRPQLIFTLSGELSIEFSYAPEIGFKFDDGQFEFIKDFSADRVDIKLDIKGKLFFGVRLDPGFAVITDDILSVSLDVTAGLDITIEGEISILDTMANLEATDSESGRVTIVGNRGDLPFTDDEFHSCFACFDGSVALSIQFGYSIKAFKKEYSKAIGKEIRIELPDLDFYISFPKEDSLIECGLRRAYGKFEDEKTCPHRKFRSVLSIKDTDGTPVQGIEVILEGLSQVTDGNGCAVFYCDPGSYDYELKFGDKSLKKASFDITNSMKTIGEKVEINEDGNITPKSRDIVTGVPNTTATTTKKVTTTGTTVNILPKEEQQIAEAKQLGDNIWGILYKSGYMLIYGSGEMYDDTSLKFGNCANVDNVIFRDDDPENGKHITSIGNGLFNGCVNLKSISYVGSPNEGKVAVDIPPSITKIGDNAFENCRSLPFGVYKLHDGIKSVGSYAFKECHGMTSCTIPDSVESMGDCIFNCCLNLEKVTLPFAGPTKDKDVSPILNTIFGYFYFDGGKTSREYEEYKGKFNSIIYKPGGPDHEITNGYLSIEHESYIPTKFKEVEITGGYQIPENGFSYCSFLEKITLPDTIESIGKYAFFNCNNITELNLTDNVKTISFGAFKQCSKLKTLHISKNLETISRMAFAYCTSLDNIKIPGTVTGIEENAFLYCTSLQHFEIENGVKSIGGHAFQECHSLKKLVIPTSVESIGHTIINKCEGLEELSIPFIGSQPGLKKANFIYSLFDYEGAYQGGRFPPQYEDKFIHHDYNRNDPDNDYGACIAAIPFNFKRVELTGGDLVPEVGFAKCSFLDEIILPEGIKSISTYDFYFCSGLKKLYIPDSVESISGGAFSGTKDLTIYGKKGSYAETFASKNNFKFVEYGSDDYKIEHITPDKVTTNIPTTTTTVTTTTTTKTTTTTTVPTPTKTTTTSSGTTKTGVRGDANGDGQVDMSDAVLIMQALANPNKYGTNGTSSTHITAEGFKFADTDGNGLTVNDALRIQKFLLGLIKSFDE